jgi:sulfofructose kinase
VPERGAPAGAGRAARIVGVGHVALDHVFGVQALPARPVKTAAQRYRCGVGGMTANALVAAARLGAEARFVGPVGDDAAADVFTAHFAREGVATDTLCRVAGAGSSVSAVIVDGGGERLIFNHRGEALHRTPAFDAAWLDGADVLLVDPRCMAWAEAALREAGRRALTVVLDADTAPREDLEGLVRLVGAAGWAVFSEPGLAAFHDGGADPALAAALAAGAGAAVLTQGDRGLVWQRAGQPVQRLPAFDLGTPVDTTAAGDVFHGALAVALAEGQGAAAALRFAAAAAALKCLRPDGVLGAPHRAEVEALLASRTGAAVPAGGA